MAAPTGTFQTYQAIGIREDLQVEVSNVGAQDLYVVCGFENAYRYWYRIAGNDSAALS